MVSSIYGLDDPATAQLLTKDPLAATTGQPYSYALDNPLNVIDPSGRDGVGLTLCAAGTVAEPVGGEITCTLAGAEAAVVAIGLGLSLFSDDTIDAPQGDSLSEDPEYLEEAKEKGECPLEDQGKQDKKLTKGEIGRLKRGGVHPHDLKQGRGTDLFKDGVGDIFEKPSHGRGPGEPTGHNIHDFP